MSVLRGRSVMWPGRAVLAVALAAASGMTSAVSAGDPLSISRLYGAGVHAYFSGDYLRSYDDLTAAIEAGSADPRPWYFRGLAALGLGRLDEAEADFSKAALIESEGGAWPVSRSLERVQGYPRFQLERHRARARVATLQRVREFQAARIEENRAAQPAVQRNVRPSGQPSRSDGSPNPFATGADAGSIPTKRAEAPESIPNPTPPDPVPVVPPAEKEPAPSAPAAVDSPAAAGTGLDPVMDQPAGAAEGERVELPEGGTAPADESADKPAEPDADTGGAPETPSQQPPAGDEPAAADGAEPMAEEGVAPAAGG